MSSNEIEDISYLKKLTTLEVLNLENNKIMSYLPLKNNSLRSISQLHISSHNFVKEINVPNGDKRGETIDYKNLPRVRKIFFDLNQLHLFGNFVNNKKRFERATYYQFMESIFLVIKNNLTFIDCDLTLNFIKNRVHFNLFYDFQVENFFSECRNFF